MKSLKTMKNLLLTTCVIGLSTTNAMANSFVCKANTGNNHGYELSYDHLVLESLPLQSLISFNEVNKLTNETKAISLSGHNCDSYDQETFPVTTVYVCKDLSENFNSLRISQEQTPGAKATAILTNKNGQSLTLQCD